MINHPYEVIVVGSGATGGIAALTLAQAGVRVLVVESGDNLSAKQAIGSEPLNTMKRVSSLINGQHRHQIHHPGYWKANPILYSNENSNPYTYPDNSPFYWTQGQQIGGRSLTWGGITLRLSDLEFKASKRDGFGPCWPIGYQDLEEHYSAIEKILKIYGNKDGLEQLPDGKYIGKIDPTPSEIYFGESIQKELGLPFISSRGFGPKNLYSDNGWPVSSSLGSTLSMALSTKNVEIVSNQKVEKIIIDNHNNSAKGVIIIDQKNGNRTKLKAKLIVLCSSTIQSIRILLSSREDNQKGGLVDPSNKLGKSLMDHVSTCKFFTIPNTLSSKFRKENQLTNELSGAGSFFIPLGSNLNKGLNNDFIRGYGIWGAIERFEPPGLLKRSPHTSTGFLIGHGEVLPQTYNRVTLSNKMDKWDIPAPHINCQWGNNEFEMVNHMNNVISNSVESAGGTIAPLQDIFKMPFIEPLITKSVALKENAPPPGFYIHEVGGAPMGSEEEESVVDPFNRLWRCQNLLVVDGACWPTSGWQSPTLTMMAITRRACLEALKHRNA